MKPGVGRGRDRATNRWTSRRSHDPPGAEREDTDEPRYRDHVQEPPGISGCAVLAMSHDRLVPPGTKGGAGNAAR